MTYEEREAIRKEAEANAARDWQYNTNPFPSTDTRKVIYDGDYKASGGKK